MDLPASRQAARRLLKPVVPLDLVSLPPPPWVVTAVGCREHAAPGRGREPSCLALVGRVGLVRLPNPSRSRAKAQSGQWNITAPRTVASSGHVCQPRTVLAYPSTIFWRSESGGRATGAGGRVLTSPASLARLLMPQTAEGGLSCGWMLPSCSIFLPRTSLSPSVRAGEYECGRERGFRGACLKTRPSNSVQIAPDAGRDRPCPSAALAHPPAPAEEYNSGRQLGSSSPRHTGHPGPCTYICAR